MDTHSLNLFLAIVRDKTISAAARSLNMTQPALSRQMQYLEEELGTKLFLRGRRHITLTEEGKFLQKRAGEILELMERTRQAFREGSQVAGEVFIAGGETRAMRYVALAARKAAERHPGLSFNIFSGNGDDVRERLDRGLADFGIFIQPVDMRSYEYLRLPAKDVWGVLMPGDHPLAARETIGPQDLADIPLITSRQRLLQNEMAAWFGKTHQSLNVVATYNLLYNASLLVEQGMGLALCLEGILRLPEDGSLVFRRLAPVMEVDVCLAWKKNQVFSRAAAFFLAVFRDEVLLKGQEGAKK